MTKRSNIESGGVGFKEILCLSVKGKEMLDSIGHLVFQEEIVRLMNKS